MGVLDDLKTNLGMGARGNKYKVMIAAPVGNSDDAIIDTICKGASIPAKTMGQIEVWNQGRKLIIAGDAQFENTWSLTFWNTQDLSLRNSFDDWITFIDSVETNTRGAVEHKDYMTEGAKVQQLSATDNSVVATYEFKNLWPTNISSIELADDAVDAITEFTVDFAYSHWIKV